jgi:hypothetical protein
MTAGIRSEHAWASLGPTLLRSVADGSFKHSGSQRYVHPTPERIETAFAGLDTYNQERATAAKDKAEKQASVNAKTLAQTA